MMFLFDALPVGRNATTFIAAYPGRRPAHVWLVSGQTAIMAAFPFNLRLDDSLAVTGQAGSMK
ncbi:hypothetical protein CA602_03575 [Paraburkholderia hospita]|nr:hypothetical protein CA602_03575 [Paraburkholderia hospita]